MSIGAFWQANVQAAASASCNCWWLCYMSKGTYGHVLATKSTSSAPCSWWWQCEKFTCCFYVFIVYFGIIKTLKLINLWSHYLAYKSSSSPPHPQNKFENPFIFWKCSLVNELTPPKYESYGSLNVSKSISPDEMLLYLYRSIKFTYSK